MKTIKTVVRSIPFTKSDMHCVAEALANLFADILSYPNNMAKRSHFHHLAIVRHPIESGMNQQTTFAEYCFDVERHLHVGSIHVFVLQNYCIKFQNAIFFDVHFVAIKWSNQLFLINKIVQQGIDSKP